MVEKWIFEGIEDKKKLAVRLITATTVLLLIFAGSPFANINTNTANAETNPYASVGTIVVNTNNSAATFNITGTANYTGSGTSWSKSDAPIGTFTIIFDSLTEYDTPAIDTQTLANGSTITFTGLYNLSVGTISVTTNNEAATFTLTGPATYTGSGTNWNQANAPIGTYTIAYDSIPGYDTPPGDIRTFVSGGTIAFTGMYNDTTPPTTTATLSGTPGNNDWNISNVTVILSAVDINGGSGVKKTEYGFDSLNWNVYTAPFIITTEGTTTVYYRSTDDADNIESAKNQTVKIDKTSPVIISSQTPAPNANGWSNANVTVHFDCSDSLSGLESCTPDNTISDEGANQLVTGTTTDKAGNFASTVVGINIDKTPPIITINTPTPFGLYPAGTALNFSATDSLSGVGTVLGNLTNINGQSQEVPNGFILSPGIDSLVVKSTDRAGNVATSDRIYFVVYY